MIFSIFCSFSHLIRIPFFCVCVCVFHGFGSSHFAQTATKHINLNNLFEFVRVKKLNAEGRIKDGAEQKKHEQKIYYDFFFATFSAA